MSEQPMTGAPVDHEALAAMISRALEDLPGVVRLEPTLKSTLTRMRSMSIRGVQKWTHSDTEPASTGRDGIYLTVAGSFAEVTVDLATDMSHSAVDTAKAAQHAAAEAIRKAGLHPGTIDVSILSIESTQSEQ